MYWPVVPAMFDVCVAGCGLYVSHVTTEEGEHGQRDAKAQSPTAQEFSELLNVELMRFRFQLHDAVDGASDDQVGQRRVGLSRSDQGRCRRFSGTVKRPLCDWVHCIPALPGSD